MIRTCISLKVLNRFSLSSVGRTSIASFHTPVMCCDDHTTSPVNNIMPVSAIYSNSVPYVCNGHTYTIPKDYQLRVIQHNRDFHYFYGLMYVLVPSRKVCYASNEVKKLTMLWGIRKLK